MKTIYFITRTNDDGYEDCMKWLEKIIKKDKNKLFQKKIVIGPEKGINEEMAEKKGFILLNDKNPTSPISLNTALDEIDKYPDKPDALFFASKEISKINFSDIEYLLNALKRSKNLLVAGYKFEYTNNKLDKELKKHYKHGGVAYTVPWNTCAMWNYNHFKRLIKRFDDICYQDPPSEFVIQVNNKIAVVKLQGMEDGLAIAEAVTKDKSIQYSLIDKPMKWKIDNEGKDQIDKLFRKNIALTTFMVARNYSFDALQKARL